MPGFTPKIPNGLEELMRGLAKSCIKNNPDNLYEFAAEYFENLVRDRDGTLDQHYKKFATYKVYRKNKKLKKLGSSGGREVSNDVNDNSNESGKEVNRNAVGIATAAFAAGNVNVNEFELLSRGKSIEEIILPPESTKFEYGKKRSLSISSESEINACIRREASFDTEAVPTSVTRCNDETADVDEAASSSSNLVEPVGEVDSAEVAVIEQEPELDLANQMTSADDEAAAASVVSMDDEVSTTNEDARDDAKDPGQDEINCEADDDIANMVLDDDMEAAALKIQAQYRGFQTRKNLNVETADDECSTAAAEAALVGGEGSIEPCACELINEQQEVESSHVEECRAEVEHELKQETCDVDEVGEILPNEEEPAGEEEMIKKSMETLESSADVELSEIESVAEAEIDANDDKPSDNNHRNSQVIDDVQEDAEDVKSMSNDDEQQQTLSNEVIDDPMEESGNVDDENMMKNDDDVEMDGEDLSDTLAEVPEMDTVVVVESQNTNNTEDGGDTLMDSTMAESDDIVAEEVSDVANENENLPQDLPSMMIDEDNAEEPAKEQADNDDESSAMAKMNESDDEREQLEFEEIERETAETAADIVDGESLGNMEQVEVSHENETEENYQRETSKESEVDIGMPSEHDDAVQPAEDTRENKSMSIEDDDKNAEQSADEAEKLETSDEHNETRDEQKRDEDEDENEVKISDIENLVEDEQENLDDVEKVLPTFSSTVEDDEQPIECEMVATEDENPTPVDGKMMSEQREANNDDEIIGSSEDAAAEADEKVSMENCPVEEEICQQKRIEPLTDDDENNKNEILRNEISLDQIDAVDDDMKNEDDEENCEIEYKKLSEEESDAVEGSVDALDDNIKSGEKSMEIVNDIERQETDLEIVEQSLSPQMMMESILNQNEEASPIELIDEVVNANADIAARELFSRTDEPSTEITQSITDARTIEEDEKVNEPQLKQETLPSVDENRIDLSKEVIETSRDEFEPINDEILKPDEDVSELPEFHESPPVDENMPQVSVDKLQENSDEIAADEKIIKSTENGEDDDDDVANMVLDDEMEAAALKIQASFRGHHKRKSTHDVTQSDADTTTSENVIEIVEIDQCANETSTTEVNEREENVLSVEEGQENDNDESAVEVERDDEGGEVEEKQAEEQEEEEEETQEEVAVEEEEAEHAVASEEAETAEDAETADPEDPQQSADNDEGETSEQPQQTTDDDDVANMVLDDEMEAAAVKIQAQFRGHITRKTAKVGENETATTKDEVESVEPAASSSQIQEIDDDVANMVLDDEMESAALKIQSAFRGQKVRNEKKKDGEEEEEEKKDEDEEKPAEEDKKEEEEAAAAAPAKTAQQLQEEEDIASIVMDEEMEQTALKIQSVFRRKGKFGKKASDGDESSACDESVKDTTEDELKQSEEKMDNGGEYVEDEKSSEYNAERYRSGGEESHNSIDQFDSSSEIGFYERNLDFFGRRTIDDPSLMHGGGVFVEPSYESTDLIVSSSGEDRDPDPNRSLSSYEKVPSDKSFEIPRRDSVSSGKSKQSSLNDEKIIDNFDFEAKKDTAEAMYYKLKKNEIETKRLSRSVSVRENLSGDTKTDEVELGEEDNKENEAVQSNKQDEDDDDVIMMRPAPTSANRRIMQGMSMDERLLGSILSSADYLRKRNVVDSDVASTTKTIDAASTEHYPDQHFDPLLEATLREHKFLMSRESDGNEVTKIQRDFPDGAGEEDTFDDFDTSNQIRRRIMASSISVADSFDFDPSNNKSIIDDDKIRTTLETIQSTDSESTIGSAATKIQNIQRRTSTTTAQFSQFSSIGNAAIDKSLDDFIYSQELKIDRFEEEIDGYSSPPPRKQESAEEWTDDTTTYTDSEQRRIVGGGVIGIKVEQKSFLTVDERRQKLHREDAIQRNSTRSDEDSSKSSNSSDKNMNKAIKRSSASANAEVATTVAELTTQDSVIDTEIKVPIIDLKMKVEPMQISVYPQKFRRQQTMPVQFQSDVIRVIPKHLRKRIKSAEIEKKRKKYEK